NRRRRSALRQRSRCLPRRRNRAFPRSATNTGKGFPSGSACAGRAARNSVRERWNVPNPRRTCRKQAAGYRQRDIALPHVARETRSTEPSCTQCLKVVVIGSIVRKAPLRKNCGKTRAARGTHRLCGRGGQANPLTFPRRRLLSAFRNRPGGAGVHPGNSGDCPRGLSMAEVNETVGAGLAAYYEYVASDLHKWVDPLSSEQFWRKPYP